MRTRALVASAAALLVLSACATDETDEAAPSPTPTAASEVRWAYTGEAGPARWGRLSEAFEACSKGKQQSPIDIVEVEPDGEVLEFSYEASSGDVINTGDNIQVKPDDGGSITVNGDRYDLVQFHFHSPSEHRVEGSMHSLEMHLVHQSPDEALAVVGVFIEEGRPNENFEPFWENLPADENAQRELTQPVDASDLLPRDSEAIYRYDGSLTTPPCTEGVKWILLPEPIEMSKEQIEDFREIYDGNARPVQPLRGREITEGELAP